MRNKLLIGAVVLIALVAGAYYWATGAVKERVARELSAACRRPVTVEKVDFALPAGIRLTGLVVPRLGPEPRAPLAIDEIYAQLVPEEAIRNRPVGDLELTGPRLWMEWNPQVRALFSKVGFRSLPNAAVAIRNLKIREGALEVADATARPPVDWHVQRFRMDAQLGASPQARSFQGEGVLLGPDRNPVGRFTFDGTRVEEGALEVNVSLTHDQIQILAPYLRGLLGPTPVAGRLDLDSRVQVREGQLTAETQVTASGIRFATGEPTTLGPPGNRLAELLSDADGAVHLGFIVQGPLASEVSWLDLAAGSLREAMRKAMTRSIHRVLIESEQGPVEDRLRQGLESLGR